jgi:hypothetical protein
MQMPANKLELWFALESERFQVPVLRYVRSVKAAEMYVPSGCLCIFARQARSTRLSD